MYLTFGLLLIVISHGILGEKISLDLFFNKEFLGFRTGQSVSNSVMWIATSIIGSLYLLAIVGRFKKCLDFTITFYIFHLIFGMLFCRTGPSSDWQWWIVTIIAAVVMVTLGEQLCMRAEMQDIVLQDFLKGPVESVELFLSSNRRRRRHSSAQNLRAPGRVQRVRFGSSIGGCRSSSSQVQLGRKSLSVVISEGVNDRETAALLQK
eukprot:g3808.t1